MCAPSRVVLCCIPVSLDAKHCILSVRLLVLCCVYIVCAFEVTLQRVESNRRKAVESPKASARTVCCVCVCVGSLACCGSVVGRVFTCMLWVLHVVC